MCVCPAGNKTLLYLLIEGYRRSHILEVMKVEDLLNRNVWRHLGVEVIKFRAIIHTKQIMDTHHFALRSYSTSYLLLLHHLLHRSLLILSFYIV